MRTVTLDGINGNNWELIGKIVMILAIAIIVFMLVLGGILSLNK